MDSRMVHLILADVGDPQVLAFLVAQQLIQASARVVVKIDREEPYGSPCRVAPHRVEDADNSHLPVPFNVF